MATLSCRLLAAAYGVCLLTGCSVAVEMDQADHPHTSSSTIETYEGIPVQGAFDIWDDGSSPMAYEILSSPWAGYLQLQEGSVDFIYWPGPGFVGDDQITYRAFNDSGYSNISSITITVWPIDSTSN